MKAVTVFLVLVVVASHLVAAGVLLAAECENGLMAGEGGLLSSSVDTFSLAEEWKMGIFSNGIGRSGILAQDLDNDGRVEIVCSGATVTFGSDDFWYVLKFDSSSSEYEMVWISQLYSPGITSISVFDADEDDIFDVLVGFSGGDIRIFDGGTLLETDALSTMASTINRMGMGDADNDGTDELVFCDDASVFAHNATSYAFEHEIGYGASDFEVGDVDGDPAWEIVLASGEVLEFDGDTALVEWDYAGGDFGYLVELSDIDSDGMEEIIGAEAWYYLTAFDADIQSPKWQINADLDVAALLVADVEGDGVDEVIYGDGQWGEIHCHDAVSSNQKWQISNPEHGVTNIAVSDADGDGDLEILWGAGATSTGEDHLYIHDIPTRALEWASDHIDGPFQAMDVGDVDSDGQEEIVIVSFESNSGYDDGVVFILDGQTHDIEWQSGFDLFGGFAWTGIHDVEIGDVDDDTDIEIVVATDELYDGAIYVIDGATHSIEASYTYDDGAPIYSIEISDVDHDGQTEIVAGGGREHTGAPGVYIYVINGSTGAVEWHSISLGDYWSEIYALEVGDVDSDTVPEIVATNDNIFVFDGVSHQMYQSTLDQCYALDLYDTDGDGKQEIVVGRDNGQVVAMDGETHTEEILLDVSAGRVEGLRVFDVDDNGFAELVLGTSGVLRIYGIADSGLIWESDPLGNSVGEHNSIVVSDFDTDDRTEVLIGTSYTVVQFDGPQQQTGVSQVRSLGRRDLQLLQNAPNPVRWSTTITYALEHDAHVRLEIFSANGQLVRTLEDRQQRAGVHSVNWDGGDLGSGLYFYRLSAGGHSLTRKCVVLR
jgi:hypothetical protein